MTMPAYNQRFTLLKQALAYAEKGWPVLPLYPVKDGICTCKAGAECQSAGKHPWVKWKSGGSTDPVQIKAWWAQSPASNIGIETGHRSGILLLDCDGESGANSIRGKELPKTPTSNTGKGKHYLFKHPDIALKTKNSVGILPGLDIRTDGGLFVAPPSQHYSGRQYAWEINPDSTPLADTPAWLVALFKEDGPIPFPLRPVPTTNPNGQYGKAALEREVRNVLDALPGTRNNALNSAAFSLGQLVAGGELDMWSVERELEYAATQAGLPQHEIKATLESGIKSGMETPRIAPPKPVLTAITSTNGNSNHNAEDHHASTAGHDTKGKKLWHVDELKEFPEPEWLYGQELQKNSLIFLVGEPNCGKSFIALDYAMQIAVTHNVVYIAGEAPSGFNKRIGAWKKMYNPPACNLYLWVDPVQMADTRSMAEFLNAVEPLKPAFFVADTLARTAVGLDENSQKDMGLYVAGCDWLRNQTGAAIMVVHHTNRNGTERGSSVLMGAADTFMMVQAEDTTRRISCKKMKDAAPFADKFVELRPSGDSLAVHQVNRETGELGTVALSKLQKEILEVLSMEVFLESGASANRIMELTGGRAATIFKALSNLKAKGYIDQGKKGDPYTLTSAGEFALEIEK